MKTIITKSYDDYCDIAANIIFAAFLKDKRVNVSITAGKSPKDVFPRLKHLMTTYKDDLKNVHYYNFDNYEDYNPNGLGGGMNALKDQYLDLFEIPESNIHLMTTENYKEINKDIENAGGLDLVLMGMGEDGHFCANLPYGCKFNEETYILPIDKSNPIYAAVYGDKPIPDYMASFGAGLIMKAKQIVLMINGKSKASAVKKLIENDVTSDFPSTILKIHPNFILLLDEEAASEINKD